MLGPMSALPPESDRLRQRREVTLCADTVAKVESCRRRIFREIIRREAIGDSYSLSRISEVVGKFSLPQRRSEIAPRRHRAIVLRRRDQSGDGGLDA
jgi:hypothetical protein